MNEKQLAKFRQKNIGFVFQSYNLIPTLSALENVSLGLIFQGVPKKREKWLKMLNNVGLGQTPSQTFRNEWWPTTKGKYC